MKARPWEWTAGTRSTHRRQSRGARTRRSSRTSAYIFAAAGVVCGILLFNWLVMPIVVRHGNEVEVPDLTGLDPKQGAARLTQVGLKLGEQRQAFDDKTPAGLIARQDPPPAFKVKKGREVHLVVSMGAEQMRVPDLVGESVDHARFVLTQRGMTIGDVRTIHDEQGEGQRVVASSPPPDSALAGRRAVDLLVNLGKAAEQYIMPDLRGMEAEPLAMELEDAGFAVRLRYAISRGGAAGRVVSQTPSPGHPIQEGGTIELVTAR